MSKTKRTFAVGDDVRYRPGFGTYGYEDMIEEDGRIPGRVVGFGTARVRVELRPLQMPPFNRSVAAQSLVKVNEMAKQQPPPKQNPKRPDWKKSAIINK